MDPPLDQSTDRPVAVVGAELVEGAVDEHSAASVAWHGKIPHVNVRSPLVVI